MQIITTLINHSYVQIQIYVRLHLFYTIILTLVLTLKKTSHESLIYMKLCGRRVCWTGLDCVFIGLYIRPSLGGPIRASELSGTPLVDSYYIPPPERHAGNLIGRHGGFEI